MLILTVLISFFSCKEKTLEKKQAVEKTSIVKKIDTIKVKSVEPPNIQIQKEFVKSILKKVEVIEKSNIEPNGGGEYEKNDKTLFLDILEEMETHEKHIMYMLSHYDDNNDRNDEGFSFYTDSKGSILIAIYEFDIFGYDDKLEKKINKIVVRDTFFFKNSRIYFWKNKQATKEELLKKEKEILAIKREIDSIMEW